MKRILAALLCSALVLSIGAAVALGLRPQVKAAYADVSQHWMPTEGWTTPDGNWQPGEATPNGWKPQPIPTVAPTAAPSERPEIEDYSRCEKAVIQHVREWCNIRQRADINSDVTGRAMLGQEISLICWNEDETWCFVDCGGEQGWIAKQFILPIK